MSIDEDRAAFERVSDDALLLRELCRRTAREAAAASASIALARTSVGRGRGGRIFDAAQARLQGFGQLNRLLARPMPVRVNLGADLALLCQAIGQIRGRAVLRRVETDLDVIWTTGRVARRMLVITAGFIDEAVGMALHDNPRCIRIALKAEGEVVSLSVEDDGRGPRLFVPGSGEAMVRAVAGELVGRSGGTITLVTSRLGTRVTVAMHSGLEGDDDATPF